MKKKSVSMPNEVDKDIKAVENRKLQADFEISQEAKAHFSEPEFRSSIEISDNVIASIVNITVKEEEGIHTLQDSLPNMIIKHKNTQGVKIVRRSSKNEEDGSNVEIDIYINIIVDFGTKIMDACKKIQEDVKNAVENLSGMRVRHVNINVVGVYSPKVSNVSKL